MNDEPTVIRQWRMLRMLGVRRHGIVVSDMAREFGVAARTIRRDLEKLQTLGFPICETTGKRGSKVWRLADHAVVPPLAFTFDEAIVLHLARPFLESLCGTQLWESAHTRLAQDQIDAERAGARNTSSSFPAFFTAQPTDTATTPTRPRSSTP